MIINQFKKFSRFIFFKYCRIIYKIKYDIPFFDTKNFSKIVNPVDYLDGVKSVAIIGKGASIFESNPREIIEKCDCKIILSRVDIENLGEYVGSKFDIQIAPQVSKKNSVIQVFPKNIIKNCGIKLLICNLDKKDERFNIFYNFFHNRVDKIGYVPSSEELNFDVNIYKYSQRGILTIASSVLRILYNIKSIEKIIFAGVDAFHYGYSQKQKTDGKVFLDQNLNYENPKETHGKPFLNFLFESVLEVNKFSKLEVYFPKILKQHINFPTHESFKFYW